MRTSTNFGLSFAALLFAIVLMPRSGWAQGYNAAAAFEQGFTTQRNPNGVWSYGYSSNFTSPITLYDQTVQNGVNGPYAQYWLSSSVDEGNSPSAQYNDEPAYNDGNVDFLAHEFLLVAGIGGQYSFRGAQYNIGTVLGVVANDTVLFDSSVTSVRQIVPFNVTVSLKAGRTLRFSVGPGGGLQNTGLALTITPTTATTCKDAATYNATTGTLTMTFTLATPIAVTWNAWLNAQNSMQTLWSHSQPITEPSIRITKTHAVVKSGKVGILSTFTTPSNGITCSSWIQVGTGTR